MLIRSQNKAAIVNFDNVFNIAAIRNINGAVANISEAKAVAAI